MVEKENIRLTLPLFCGALICVLLLTHTWPSHTAYFLAGVSFAISLGMAAYAVLRRDEEDGWARYPLFWILCLGMLGIFCAANRHIVLTTRVGSAMLEGAVERINLLIDGIGFKEPMNRELMRALLLGDKSGLSKELVQSFRDAGGAHLLALSGMHLGMIYGIMSLLLKALGNFPLSRQLRSCIVIAACGYYCLMCGAGPSLFRAFLFILIAEGGKMLGRSQKSVNIFCTALALHIILRSEDLAMVSFQLSWCAMAGIVFLWPWMKELMTVLSADKGEIIEGRMSGAMKMRFTGNRLGYEGKAIEGPVNKIWELASLSISAQAATAPLSFLYFGTFPKYFLITNLTAAPLMTVAMTCCLIAAALSLICPESSIGAMPVQILEYPLSWLRQLLQIIASM